MPEPPSVEGVGGEVSLGVRDHQHALPGQRQLLRTRRLPAAQWAQHLAERRVDQHRTVERGGDDEAEFCGDEHAVDGRVVSRERHARRRTVALADDAAVPGRPMPEQHGAVLGAGRDVAVRGDVALGPANARHHAVVTEYYLHYFSSFSWEDPKAIIPEAGRDEELGVDGRHEAVGARADPLAEVVAELPPRQRLRPSSGPDWVHE